MRAPVARYARRAATAATREGGDTSCQSWHRAQSGTGTVGVGVVVVDISSTPVFGSPNCGPHEIRWQLFALIHDLQRRRITTPATIQRRNQLTSRDVAIDKTFLSCSPFRPREFRFTVNFRSRSRVALAWFVKRGRKAIAAGDDAVLVGLVAVDWWAIRGDGVEQGGADGVVGVRNSGLCPDCGEWWRCWWVTPTPTSHLLFSHPLHPTVQHPHPL